ncbi:fzo1p [Saccharomyces arboricola H-6]|uniref:Fzo1p n=1 Tax=Saccharomyces arboricola (strain H-6 / AS 2.3317 / CBS 10644) TaxID=1160507 RepID=J8Q510_SACAR|nr:fzo1p [Saccharomyces arboricola H-6]
MSEEKKKSQNMKRPHRASTDQDDDAATVVPPTLTYSRSEGQFSTSDDHSTLFDGKEGHRDDDLLPSLRASGSKAHLISSQLSQWNYNNNRVLLKRSILKTQAFMDQLQEENNIRPIFIAANDEREKLHVLQLNIKLDGHYNTNEKNDFNMEKKALSKLFQSQIESVTNHLNALKKRVDDVSSKVFITGDVNTGKSALCNSLLKQRLLPEDQLPCTNVFSEILEARENDGIEEVHAIPLNIASTLKEAIDMYSIQNSKTYEIHTLKELPDLVCQNEKYALLKIYIKDNKRPASTSLLRNGTVDISLIDSPGLNMDSLQTAEVMSRQEEIDLVIFVVNAENQLTLSAKEFISLASREKKLMFFVVKKFDKIRDKQRCKELILKQIRDLSPETHKRAADFVHFVSKNGDEMPHYQGDNDNDDNDNGKPDNDPYSNSGPDPDFDSLEDSLRNFVLKKRSLSKLLPAKTYLSKLLSDITMISRSNIKMYGEEEKKINEQLETLRPEILIVKTKCNDLTTSVDKMAEETTMMTYNNTKETLLNALEVPLREYPKYQGLAQIYDFIFSTEDFIISQIDESITSSELFAKQKTDALVKTIYEIGKSELGDDFMCERVFKSELMFRKRKHLISKRFRVSLSITDLFAPSWKGFLSYLSWQKPATVPIPDIEGQTGEEQTGIMKTLGLKSYPLTQYWSRPSLLFTSKIPTLTLYFLGSTKVAGSIILNGIKLTSWNSLKKLSIPIIVMGSLLGITYLINDLPRALPMNLSGKYKRKLQELDYIHLNAQRTSNEVRDVLRVPTREILRSCEIIMDKKQVTKKELESKKENNLLSIKFFHSLHEGAVTQNSMVEEINLDID